MTWAQEPFDIPDLSLWIIRVSQLQCLQFPSLRWVLFFFNYFFFILCLFNPPWIASFLYPVRCRGSSCVWGSVVTVGSSLVRWSCCWNNVLLCHITLYCCRGCFVGFALVLCHLSYNRMYCRLHCSAKYLPIASSILHGGNMMNFEVREENRSWFCQYVLCFLSGVQMEEASGIFMFCERNINNFWAFRNSGLQALGALRKKANCNHRFCFIVVGRVAMAAIMFIFGSGHMHLLHWEQEYPFAWEKKV